jgi:arylsulfatase
VPDDRAIDGVDQTAFLLGETETSARESVLIFSSRTLLAVKWRRFKVFLTGDDPAPRNRAWRRLYAPLVFNVEQDPREEVDIGIRNLWVLEPVLRAVYPFLFSIEDEGLILPGGDEPQPSTVEIPFQSQDEIERSMSAIRWQFMKRRAKEMIGLDSE